MSPPAFGRKDIEAAFDAFFNPRGLRAWQLAEEHGLALERQAEEHHRSEAEQKRESRKLPSQVERRREWSKRRQRPWRLFQMSVAPQATS